MRNEVFLISFLFFFSFLELEMNSFLIISSCQHVFKRNLSELRGNLLGYLDSEFKPDCKKFFPGVCSPYYFIGLRGTVFPHHCEDMDLISVNFMEQGYPKIW